MTSTDNEMSLFRRMAGALRSRGWGKRRSKLAKALEQIHGDISRIDDQLRAQIGAIDQKTAEINQRAAELEVLSRNHRREFVEYGLRLRELVWRRTFDGDGELRRSRPLLPPRADHSYEATLARLESWLPEAFETWQRLCANGEEAYRRDPHGNLSSLDHPNPAISMFRLFTLPQLRGRVLDVGCGPLPVPCHLDGYPLDLIAGIDPFGEQTQHPFMFVRGVAEDLPWPDGAFETVTNAGSLDHMLDLEKGVAEHARVLTPDGELLLLVYFVPGAARYDPHDPRPVDDFHLFHFDLGWFEELMAPHFMLMERLSIDGGTHFYRYRNRAKERCTPGYKPSEPKSLPAASMQRYGA